MWMINVQGKYFVLNLSACWKIEILSVINAYKFYKQRTFKTIYKNNRANGDEIDKLIT